MSNYNFDSVIFDLDGVITKTALIHAQAWKLTFDEYLLIREAKNGESFREFTYEGDYLPYVDGKPRYEGVKSFLESRGISVPYGESSDKEDAETVCGIGNKKNAMFSKALDTNGVDVYSSTIELIKNLRDNGIRVGVASSSKNCKIVLESAGIQNIIETRVDGMVSVELGLKGKPEPDIFVTAARNLNTIPKNSIVIEDASAGVLAGRNGGFGLVVGVARQNNSKELLDNGADIVVSDLADLDIEYFQAWFNRKPKPLFEFWDSPEENKNTESKIMVNPLFFRSAKSVFCCKKKLVFFLDYDGTLTPIVDRPDYAILDEEMRMTVRALAEKYSVAIVSGRMREDVQKLVGIQGIFYAGSHGCDIDGPGVSMVQPKVKDLIPVINDVIAFLSEKLNNIPNILIEEKKFSVAVHYRLVDEKYLEKIKEVVSLVISDNKKLKLMKGKMVFEILPDIDWDKGKAIQWIMKALGISWSEASVIYIGDDVTDENAFRAIRTRGTGILVTKTDNPSSADFKLNSPTEVKKLFNDVFRL